MNIHPYKHTYTYLIPMRTSERLSQFDLEIYKISYQECLIIDGDVTFH
jgi:hypothetical protein